MTFHVALKPSPRPFGFRDGIDAGPRWVIGDDG
jgi:hypothetical protein